MHQTSLSPQPIMTSCVIPKIMTSTSPVMLLHGFDRSGLAFIPFKFSFLFLLLVPTVANIRLDHRSTNEAVRI